MLRLLLCNQPPQIVLFLNTALAGHLFLSKAPSVAVTGGSGLL